MLTKLKQRFCKHKYELVTIYKEDIKEGVGFELADIHVVCCINCEHVKRMQTHEFHLLMFKQKISRRKQAVSKLSNKHKK